MGPADHYNLSRETMQRILDNICNEVYVTDADFKILYISGTSYARYGLRQEEMIGRSHHDFDGTYWFPSSLPKAYQSKQRTCVLQTTIKGEPIVSISNPVLDDAGRIKLNVAMVQGQHSHYDLDLTSGDQDHQLIQWSKHTSKANIITVTPKMQELLTYATRSAQSDVPILICGDSGTGKTALAQYIHEHSQRRDAPFLSINCAAIPEALLESELFGYVPYAFTGASKNGKDGLLKLAHNGTLFLDEIAELSPALQAKLLTVIERHMFCPIGSHVPEHINVRIIAATNKDLEKRIQQKAFREDLYWRLTVVKLFLPPLSHRRDDIIPLANYYLNIFKEKYHKDCVFDMQVLKAFQQYDWPGNVRQLRNMIEWSVVVASAPVITPDDLPSIFSNTESRDCPDKGSSFAEQMAVMERDYVRKHYMLAGSSRKLAAAIRVSQSQANRLIQMHCPDLR